jgi:hypothetical protein
MFVQQKYWYARGCDEFINLGPIRTQFRPGVPVDRRFSDAMRFIGYQDV